jgi:hypothetical protein
MHGEPGASATGARGKKKQCDCEHPALKKLDAQFQRLTLRD